MYKDVFLDRLWRSRTARAILASGAAAGLAIAATGCGSGAANNAGKASGSRGGATPAAAGRTPGQQVPAAGEGGALVAPRTTSQLCTVGLKVVETAFSDPSATCMEQTDPSSDTQVYEYMLSGGELDVSETSGVSYAYLAGEPGMTAGPKVDGHAMAVGNPGSGEQALVDMGGDYGSIVTLQLKDFNGADPAVLGRQLTAAAILAEAF